ncbi:MAG: hypothetical protein R3F61_25345 [Myxococcota bacterium]
MASVLAASAPTEAEQRAYFDENREIFGTRTYERSEDRIRRILTFRKAAEHLRR